LLSKDIQEKFIAIVGKDNFECSNMERAAYSFDSSPLQPVLPAAVVAPRNTAEVSEIVKLCNKHLIPIVSRGSGTNLAGGTRPTEDAIVLIFRNMNSVVELDEENLTITVQPGVITSDIHTIVEAKGLFYPPDPSSMKMSMIGGNIVENAGGLRGLKYGVTGDYVMGLEVVLPNGEIIKTGGKLAKDVAGYNLTQLMVGSEGTLGVVTEAILKLIPKPETKKTMIALFPDLNSAAQTVSDIIANKIIPVTLEFLDKATLKVVEDYAKVGLPTDCEALLLIEQDGPASIVERDINKIAEICKAANAMDIKIAANDQEADKLATARRSALSALARLAPTTLLEDATVPRSEIANMVRAINEVAAKYNVQICTFGHAGDGNLHPTCPTDIRNKEEYHRAESAFAELFEVAVKLGGTITGEHGVGIMKQSFLHLKVGHAGIEAMKAIKLALDPNNIMNPGKIFDVTKTEVSV
jgi:glycolate oxidase